MNKNIAILGAGFGGLAAAYDLVRRGYHVTVYEGTEKPGGLAGGFKEPHWEWSVEKFYHHWFASDRHMLGLLDELGWRDRVLFPRPFTVMYHQGNSTPLIRSSRRSCSPGWDGACTRRASGWWGCTCG